MVVMAVTLRIVLALFSFHPDLDHFITAVGVLSQGHILDFYDHSSTEQIFNYPPAIYLLDGLYGMVLGPLLASNGWLLKLGYLPFDLALGFSLMHFFSGQKEKLLALGLWLFNPINLHATYLMGQFDVIPTMFVVLALVLLVQGRQIWGGLSLGMGVAFKIFPIFLLIPFLLQIQGWTKRLIVTVAVLVPYLIGNSAYLSSEGFRSSAIVASQSLKSFYATIPVSGGQAILLFPALLIFGFAWFYYQKTDNANIWRRFLVVLGLFFILTHTHPQWLVWLTPFLILDLVSSNFKNLGLTFGIVISWTLLLFFFDPSLSLGLFVPGSVSLWEQLGVAPDYTFWRSMLHSLFAGLMAYLIFLQLKSENRR